MEHFKNVAKIKYEGSKSKNPFAFKYYNPEEVVLGKKMKDHLKFSMAYWHTLTYTGTDPFGSGTMERPWDLTSKDELEIAKTRVKVGFEFMEKIGMEYFCFHDVDIAPQGNSLEEFQKNLDVIVDLIEKEMKRTGIKLLWGTANLFGHKRFMNGASTSPNADVFAYSAAQIKKAMEITHRLNGAGYTFWGGREGYETLLNTDYKLEQDNFARMLHMAVDYAKEIGYKGQFYIEPKPKEPTKHQYDFDSATVIGFLRKYNLEKHFKLNIETNHATLSGHTVNHEIRVAATEGLLGSLDANQGDLLLGWDTDQFPTNLYDSISIMYEVLRAGGLKTGGLNFDSKVRRASNKPEDLFLAHIAGMDSFAAGLKIAAKMWEDGVFEDNLKSRYSSYTKGIGKDIVDGKVGFKELEKYVFDKKDIDENESGKQEYLEALINQYILG
ncbi:xylose isomerase [Haploplasma axanthum]|uniref:Xylose isomerase n=1 Tax=Haploplasma axanthum TaxID=29552 RepID=A0A449BBN3_HAPAX|nr:xylose isomerase [Haploplasma axanthum]VEU79861.1 Xylose isomerase [Haploplasma axanthum]